MFDLAEVGSGQKVMEVISQSIFDGVSCNYNPKVNVSESFQPSAICAPDPLDSQSGEKR